MVRDLTFHKTNTILYESEKAVRSALIELCIYLWFLTMAIIVAKSTRDKYMFYFNESVHKVFMSDHDPIGFETMETTADWWSFFETKFLDSLHGEAEDSESHNNQSLVFLEENILLGPPRIRQIRVKEGSCNVAQVLQKYFKTCFAGYSSKAEDRSETFKGTNYYTLAELDANSIWGDIAIYRGGGYVQDLTYDKKKNIEILAELKAKRWIDRGTRVVLVEFTLYNVNTGLLDSVKLISELPPTGGISTRGYLQTLKLSSIWWGDGIIALIAIITFYLMIAYYTLEEIIEFSQKGVKNYFKSLWNTVDLIIIITAYLSLAYTIWHLYYRQKIFTHMVETPNKYLSLDTICFWNMLYQDIMGLCVFFVCIKVFKFISFNKSMLQFSITFQRCFYDLLGFGLMFSIVFLAYAELGLLLFGTVHPDFRNFKEAVLTMLRMVLGDFEYAAIEKANRVLGPIYFLTYILLVFFILLNMFLAIINDTYNDVKQEIKLGDNHLQMYLSKLANQLYGKIQRTKLADSAPGPIVHGQKERRRFDRVPSDSTIYPNTSSTSEFPLEHVRMRESEILSEFVEKYLNKIQFFIYSISHRYFEEIQSLEDTEKFRNLKTRISLLEEVMEQLVSDIDRILHKVESKKRTTKRE